MGHLRWGADKYTAGANLLLAERKDKVGLNKHGKVVMSGLSVQAYIWEKEEGSAELEIYISIGTILVHLLVK